MVEIPRLRPGITLPASGDGFQVDTLSAEEFVTPAAEWREKLPYGIILFSDDWAKLKYVLLKNCLSNDCKQAVGTVDTLFQTVDQVLRKLPGP